MCNINTNLLKFAEQVIDNADDTGCSDDLTVTSKSAIDGLAKEINKLKKATDVRVGTVNVIEMGNERTDILSLRSFIDTKKGNKSAEKLFSKIYKENAYRKPSKEEIEVAIENGYWEDPRNGHTLLLVHST